MAHSCAALKAPSEEACSLVSLLEWRAVHQSQRWAYSFLADGQTEEVRWTYGDLDREARRVASLLQRTARPGERALLLYPAGLDFLAAFLGCLYAGVVAVPLFAPRPNKGLTRLQTILADSGAHLALTVSRTLADLATWGQDAQLNGVEYLTTDDREVGSANDFRPRAIDRHELAFLQYTSGSTSAPRGVMVTHGHLVYNCAYMREAFSLSPDTIAVTWLPHFHDMGLIEGLLNPLFTGYPTVTMPPAQFVQRPLSWLEAVSKYRATHSGAPNFAYDLCVDKIKPEDRASLNLTSWSMAYCGAEPVRRETLDRFAEQFAPLGFSRDAHYPCYGLAEATLMVCGGHRSEPPIYQHVDAEELEQNRIVPAPTAQAQRTLVGCGHARRETQIAIVDPGSLQRLPDHRVGEIWVQGPTVASGYWQRGEESRATFAAQIAGESAGSTCLRTGDLGYLSAGELFITGRLKDLIIIRGGNLYPQDLECAAERAHPALKPGFAAAFSMEADGEERLVMAHEVDRHHRKLTSEQFEEVAIAVRRAVAEQFDMEVYRVALFNVGAINRTSSGKIQRQACRADYLAGRADLLWDSRLPPGEKPPQACLPAPDRRELLAQRPADRRRALETYLRQRLGDAISQPWRSIDPGAPLGSLGIDSLKGAELTALLQAELNLKLSPTLVWNHPTIAALALHLAESLGLDLEHDPGEGADSNTNGRAMTNLVST